MRAFFRADRRVRRKTRTILFHRFRRTFAKERAQIGTDFANVADEFVVLIRPQLDGDADRAT